MTPRLEAAAQKRVGRCAAAIAKRFEDFRQLAGDKDGGLSRANLFEAMNLLPQDSWWRLAENKPRQAAFELYFNDDKFDYVDSLGKKDGKLTKSELEAAAARAR